MNIQPAPIYIFSGPPGAGKSTVARLLVQQFPFGMHLEVDHLREWVVSGRADPVPTWSDETTRQFTLARESAAFLAGKYARAGFAVAVDDIIFPGEVRAIYEEYLAGLTIHKILLLPSLEVALQRNASRTNKDFDTSFLIDTILGVHQALQAQPFADFGWHILQTDGIDAATTVQKILLDTRHETQP